jgi:hypothetical protein
MGGILLGFRNEYENNPKTNEPNPVPVSTTPLTYIFLPGKYLLHSTTGIIKLNPLTNPKSTPYTIINPPIFFIKLLTKTNKDCNSTTQLITINACIPF